jgi:hypothetical protein
MVLKSGSLNLLEPSGPVQVCNGIALPFLLNSFVIHVAISEIKLVLFDGHNPIFLIQLVDSAQTTHNNVSRIDKGFFICP